MAMQTFHLFSRACVSAAAATCLATPSVSAFLVASSSAAAPLCERATAIARATRTETAFLWSMLILWKTRMDRRQADALRPDLITLSGAKYQRARGGSGNLRETSRFGRVFSASRRGASHRRDNRYSLPQFVTMSEKWRYRQGEPGMRAGWQIAMLSLLVAAAGGGCAGRQCCPPAADSGAMFACEPVQRKPLVPDLSLLTQRPPSDAPRLYCNLPEREAQCLAAANSPTGRALEHDADVLMARSGGLFHPGRSNETAAEVLRLRATHERNVSAAA